MGFFGFLFWMAVIWFAFKIWRNWQCQRLAPVNSQGDNPSSGWYDSSEFYPQRQRGIDAKGRGKLQNQQEYIDSLESRVSELEERLDFTERLLASRRDLDTQAAADAH